MSHEILNIKTSGKKFFLQYLMLKKPVIDMYVSKYTGKQTQVPAKILHVLSLLLYYYNMYSDIDEEDRWYKIFDKKHRDMICSDLDIKDQQLNTYFSMMRGYKIISNNIVNKLFIVMPDNEHELIFKFSINGEE